MISQLITVEIVPGLQTTKTLPGMANPMAMATMAMATMAMAHPMVGELFMVSTRFLQTRRFDLRRRRGLSVVARRQVVDDLSTGWGF